MAMATVEIRCTVCGETFTHSKNCHSRKEADSYEAWAAENVTVCPHCYAEQKRKEAEKRAAEREEKAAKYPLCELSGTEKQVKWANSIRAKFVDEIVKTYELEGDEDIVNYFNAKSEARYWIDNRNNDFGKIVEDLNKAFEESAK